MNPRYGICLAAVLAFGSAAPAFAATKPLPKSCSLLSDSPGDATQAAGPSSDSIDIVGGDLGSGAKNLVVLLRLKSLAKDPLTTPGATYVFTWQAGATKQTATLLQFSDGTRKASFKADAATGSNVAEVPVGYGVDTATATILWSIPRRVVPQLKTKGVKFTGLAASARPAVNIAMPTGSASTTILSGDEASSPRSYVDSTPTCVKGI
jgi:hypothetical protein